MMKHALVKYGLMASIWLLLLAPLAQQLTGIIPEKPLNGDFISPPEPVLTWPAWISGTFQEAVIPYIDENTGFHSTLIRINNQVNYSLFGIISTEGVVAGRNNNLFEYDYIRAYLGDDFIGERFIDEKMRRVKYIQEYLRLEKNIHVCLVFEPSKVRFMPDQLSAEYRSRERSVSNYDVYLRKAAELGINHINLNQHYIDLKNEALYPLYTPYGIHWSLYGMSLCADSILRYTDAHYPGGLPGYEVSFFESGRPLKTDNDIEKAMNLLFPLESPLLAYPEYSFDTLYDGPRPNALAVADSYYFNIFNTGIPEFLFNNQAFWYFNSIVYPDNYFRPAYVADLDIKAEAEKQDFIFLMVTERFLHRFDWEFFDMLYRVYTPFYFDWPDYNYFNDILNNDPHFNELIREAGSRGITLEEELWEHADFLFLTNRHNEYMVHKALERQMEIIRNDTGWFSDIRRKAAENGIGIEEMLELDARFILRQETPEQYSIYQELEEIKHQMRTDTALGRKKILLQQEYYLSGERASEIAAFRIYRERETERIAKAIRSDPVWLEHVAEKARKNGISTEEMIVEDAKYVFAENYRKLTGTAGR